MKLTVERITLEEANVFVLRHHRHSGRVLGHVFSIGASLGGMAILGVAIVGRPLSRELDDGVTADVARVCTDGTPNASSFLYGAATRAALALGFKRVVTYTLRTESGVSLRAAGFRVVADVRGNRRWDTPARPRVDVNPNQDKFRWEACR